MTTRTFDDGEVVTALCLWEAWLDIETIGYAKQQKGEDPGDTYIVLQELRDNHGCFVCRQLMIDITHDCDVAFEAAQALNGGDYDGAFDFDFCPEFLSGAAASGLLDDRLKRQYGGQPGPYSSVIAA